LAAVGGTPRKANGELIGSPESSTLLIAVAAGGADFGKSAGCRELSRFGG